MRNDVFATLIANLKRIAFAGRISYHRYSEPLLRKDLEKLVSIVSDELPQTKQVLYTNGDLLSSTRYVALREAGIAQFIVTRHDNTPMPNRPGQVVLFPRDLLLTNRGGLLSDVGTALHEPCFAPSEMLIVAINGDILLCYEDSRATNVMGNIVVSSLEAIWFAPHFAALRQSLASGQRTDACSLCSTCDNRAHTAAERSWFMETRRGIF